MVLGEDKPVKTSEDEKLEVMRHSAAHVMAEAVQSIFPDAKFGIGPAIKDGFYYDFDLPRSLTPDDLPVIEAKMRAIIAADQPFMRQEVSRDEARQVFASQPYKLELLDEIPDEKVSLYRQGSFIDLCRGPHVSSSGEIKAFKLISVAGAYWRGSENQPMLQRIYGVAFDTEEALTEHLERIEEATRRDHRKLGRELDLFNISEEAGPGLVLWHPKGAVVRRVIEDFWKEEHIKRGYDLVYTPHVAKIDLWKTSGHWELYRDYLYSPMDVEGQQYIIKPMNCPGHILIYKSKLLDTMVPERPPYPDIVLPGANFAESEGTYTNCERRIQGLRRALVPPAGKENWEVISALSTALGYPMEYRSVSDIESEIAKLVPIYRTGNGSQYPEVGGQWSFLKNGRFDLKDGLAQLQLVEAEEYDVLEALASLS